ncbi:periplasmic solute binding protein [Enterobacter cancerogenus]|uniref:Periplasmic solute binding protein n=1 Tax=Enterobacter cancerogenus TaxID=69218 RepID=A0A484YRM5_9ENTR|nr:periplasmic solute binding protein [Enterobacter cancerogenus]
MHPLQGLKRLLLGALFTAVTTTGAVAAEKFQVITTFTVIADMAKNVAGGRRRGHLYHQTGRGNP